MDREKMNRETAQRWCRDERLELHPETGEPFFLHANRCRGYCDYACADGFERAEEIIEALNAKC